MFPHGCSYVKQLCVPFSGMCASAHSNAACSYIMQDACAIAARSGDDASRAITCANARVNAGACCACAATTSGRAATAACVTLETMTCPSLNTSPRCKHLAPAIVKYLQSLDVWSTTHLHLSFFCMHSAEGLQHGYGISKDAVVPKDALPAVNLM